MLTRSFLFGCILLKQLCFKIAFTIKVVTLSTLKFKTDGCRYQLKNIDQILKRYRETKIPIEKFDLLNYSDSGGVYPMIDKWLDVALKNGVQDV